MFKIQALVACLALLWAPAELSALSIPEIVSKARPAVLKITSYDSSGKPLRFGTGFFISDDGLLVTNQHVIEDARAITAKSVSGTSYTCEGVLDEPKDSDLVVLKFKARSVESLVVGYTSKVKEGQKVVVIGNPEGLEGTVSEGIIAAIRDNPHLIQITAPISPGSSGSPVLDETGQVIGIATFIYKEGQNLNFAIPVGELLLAIVSGPKEATPFPPIWEASHDRVQAAPDISQAAQSPYDFKLEAPMDKLSTEVDFTKTVYAQATQSLALSFWEMPDRDTPGKTRSFRAFYSSSSDKVTFKITCDWKERTATVTRKFIDANDEPKEYLEAFRITNLDIRHPCLMRVSSDGDVFVITMGAELGSFIDTECAANGFVKQHGTSIFYGTCKN